MKTTHRFLLSICLMALCVFSACFMISCHHQTPTEEPDPALPNDPETGETESGPSQEPGKPEVYDFSKKIYPEDKNIESLSVLEQGDGFVTSYRIRDVEGIRTTFQTSTGYGSAYAVHSDSVMVYGDSSDRFASWIGSKSYIVDMMIAINRADLNYLNADKDRYKDIQMDRNGEYLIHSTGGAYYMVPTERWTEYVWSMLKNISNRYHPSMIVMEEPEMWFASGYSEGFKAEWEKYYKEPWQDPSQNTDAAFKSMRLKVYLFERLIQEISARMKASFPEIKLLVATHSSVNYAALGIVAGMNHYLDLDGALDGIIGQTWSNTSHMSFPYQGISRVDEFANSYIDYASYLDSVSDSLFYALADPMADGNAYTEEHLTYMYRQNVAAQLMFPEVQRFEILPWVNRAFANVSSDYKTIQMQIFNMLNDIGGKDVVLESGTPGVSYLLSDSVAWIETGDQWSLSAPQGLYGVTMPLLYDGIPVKVKSMEQLYRAEDLKDVSLLIVSYDNQLPDHAEVNEAIADYVKKGGTVLVLTGHNKYWEATSQCWSGAGSPLNDLIEKLGLGLHVSQDLTTGEIKWSAEDEPDQLFEPETLFYVYGNYTNTFEGSDHVLMTFGDRALAVEERVGKGHIVFCGLPTGYYASSESAAGLVRSLTAYALQYTAFDYVWTDLLTVRRGNYMISHALQDDETIEGLFIDLYDPALSIKTRVEIPARDSVILYDISKVDLSIPRLGYTGGTLLKDAEEHADRTVLSMKSASSATVATRLLAPKGTYPQKVTVTSNGQAYAFEKKWNNATSSLLITVPGTTEGFEIAVEWGKTFVEDDANVKYDGITVETNERGQDEPYIFDSNAQANGSVRYCDLERYVVYRFDLGDDPLAVYSFKVCQNYLCEVSSDGEHWTVLSDYSKIGPRIENASNQTDLTVRPADFGFEDEFYFRLRNSSPNYGWGGAIISFSIKTPVPSGEDEATYVPFHPTLEKETHYQKTQYSERAGEKKTWTIPTNSSNQDRSFLILNSAQSNGGLRYCDAAGELVYAFDITHGKDNLIQVTICQNYYVEVSDNGQDWFVVADYSEGGTRERIHGAGNQTTLTVDPEDFGLEGYVYIHIRNTNRTDGYGGAVSKIVWTYTALEDRTYSF